MNEYKIKEQICEIGRRLYAKGFAAANDGNITVRLNDREILCTPTLVSKGFMKPEDICKVDYDGKQLAGTRKRTSEVLLHLVVYKNRPDINAVVHCHPPHATAFAVAHEPIPKCILPEVEVFLGEVPIAKYATPGDQRLPNTILPYVKDCNTVMLANHGSVSWGPTLEQAYFNTEIVDAYCRILILAKQLGRVNYFSAQETAELLDFKKRLNLDDPRVKCQDCDLCGNNIVGRGVTDFQPQPQAFRRQDGPWLPKETAVMAEPARNGQTKPAEKDLEKLVQLVTDQVMAALAQNSSVI